HTGGHSLGNVRRGRVCCALGSVRRRVDGNACALAHEPVRSARWHSRDSTSGRSHAGSGSDTRRDDRHVQLSREPAFGADRPPGRRMSNEVAVLTALLNRDEYERSQTAIARRSMIILVAATTFLLPLATLVRAPTTADIGHVASVLVLAGSLGL